MCLLCLDLNLNSEYLTLLKCAFQVRIWTLIKIRLLCLSQMCFLRTPVRLCQVSAYKGQGRLWRTIMTMILMSFTKVIIVMRSVIILYYVYQCFEFFCLDLVSTMEIKICNNLKSAFQIEFLIKAHSIGGSPTGPWIAFFNIDWMIEYSLLVEFNP